MTNKSIRLTCEHHKTYLDEQSYKHSIWRDDSRYHHESECSLTVMAKGGQQNGGFRLSNGLEYNKNDPSFHF